MSHSIILTVHNKGWLIQKVIDAIYRLTSGSYELIIVLDGCTDNSQDVVLSSIKDDTKVLYADNVFETKANNIGLKAASGDKVIIVQDDMIVNEDEWNLRLQKPFDHFSDVFAVTARTAHNWEFNPNSIHLNMSENLNDCWCDILNHTDHAHRSNISRDTFAVRSSVNRGPLMIDHSVLQKMNYLDEEFYPQDMDDHDFCFRVHKELGLMCGCYWIDFITEDLWGGTRVFGGPAPWLYNAHHKNTKLFYSRHNDLIDMQFENEDRILL